MMIVSRCGRSASSRLSSGMEGFICPPDAGSGAYSVGALLVTGALGALPKMGVVIVRDRRGMLFFLVRRIEAWLAFWADLSAFERFWSGTSRFIVSFSAAD